MESELGDRPGPRLRCSKIKMKKFLSYILILVTLVGLFSPGVEVQAQNLPLGTCTTRSESVFITETSCTGEGGTWTRDTIIGTCAIPVLIGDDRVSAGTRSDCNRIAGRWSPETAPAGTVNIAPAVSDSTLEQNLISCGVIMSGSLGGCLVTLFYYIFYGLASFLLTVAAKFFDIVLALSLSSTLYGPFISDAWSVVRDLSNLFFILILLFVAIQTILGMGDEAKKTIARIIVMALLINFSMFF